MRYTNLLLTLTLTLTHERRKILELFSLVGRTANTASHWTRMLCLYTPRVHGPCWKKQCTTITAR